MARRNVDATPAEQALRANPPAGVSAPTSRPVVGENAVQLLHGLRSRDMSATEEIRKSIESRLRAIETEVVSLNAALSRLRARDGAPQAAANGNRRQKASSTAIGRRRNTTQRSTTTASPAVLEQLLGAVGASSTAELAKYADADRVQVLAQLKQLEAEGRIRRTGQRRAVRWHAITDEDRIRERAAELERRSRKQASAR
jgi:hypothetical protein